MDSRWNAFNRLANEIRFGQRLEKISAADVKPVDATVVRRLDHLDGVQPALRRNVESPQLAHSARAFFIDREAARKLIGNAADFGAALHARMAAYRHQSRLRPPYETPSQRQVNNRAHIRDAVEMLRDPHGPDEDSRSGFTEHSREPHHLLAAGARRGFERFCRIAAELRFQFIKTARVLFDEELVRPSLFDQVFDHSRYERLVAARVNLEESVRDLRPEHRALCD